MKRKHIVYQQGDMDCLCAVYALVNLVNHLRGPFSYEESAELFNNLLDTFEWNWTLKVSIVEGVNGMQFSRLLKEDILEEFGLVLSKPFHNRPLANKQAVLARIKSWTGNQGVVVWGNETHWSVIVGVKGRSFVLVDSAGRACLDSAFIQHSAKGDYQLCPQHLYFIKRKEDVL